MLATSKTDLLKELKRRVEDKILEPTNYELLKKLIEKADTLDEAIMITELGTTYKRTGFHFDKRLEKLSDTIKYFKKNDALSFETDPSKKHHKLIIGDNYPALLNLLIEYKGSVDVIYIDHLMEKIRWEILQRLIMRMLLREIICYQCCILVYYLRSSC